MGRCYLTTIELCNYMVCEQKHLSNASHQTDFIISELESYLSLLPAATHSTVIHSDSQTGVREEKLW